MTPESILSKFFFKIQATSKTEILLELQFEDATK
jgi:hypothetical protein